MSLQTTNHIGDNFYIGLETIVSFLYYQTSFYWLVKCYLNNQRFSSSWYYKVVNNEHHKGWGEIKKNCLVAY